MQTNKALSLFLSLSLSQDNENKNKELPFQHQEVVADCLGQAEGLLKDLFLDVDRSKKMGHPQAGEIENE